MRRSSTSKQFPCILWTSKFVPAYITAHHLFLFWARPIQSTLFSQSRVLLDILILHFHLCLGIPSEVFSQRTLHVHLLSPVCAPCPTYFIFLIFIHSSYIITWAILVRSANQETPQCAISSSLLLPPHILGPNVFLTYSILKHSQNGRPICAYFGISDMFDNVY